jgi:Leucine-rich repeat (LRR) protein
MAALAASPFALLDAHSSLRLVTDVVHEDDALCLALVCRALHDALWARFPARPAGHAHAGKRLRTRDAAVGRLGSMVTADGMLRLSFAYRNGLPEGIGRLVYLPRPGLKTLVLGNVRLTALPEGLWSLAGLEELDLGGCRLTALPEGIGRLAGLRKLILNFNTELTALPAGLCGLARLEELALRGCGLTALPEGIGGLSGLRKLDLGWNHGLAGLPEGLWSLVGLQELHLGGCGLRALPEGATALAGLKKLVLHHNIELAALPAGLDRLRDLVHLDLLGCPGLAALLDLRVGLQERDGLRALLAHLAAQGESAVAEGQL